MLWLYEAAAEHRALVKRQSEKSVPDGRIEPSVGVNVEMMFCVQSMNHVRAETFFGEKDGMWT